VEKWLDLPDGKHFEIIFELLHNQTVDVENQKKCMELEANVPSAS
jgi:hypothetical protein